MSNHPTFPIILRWSEEQGASIEQVQKLAGVEGTVSTYEEALASVPEAIRWWQEMSARQPTPPVYPENDLSR